jgi:glycosyltransferase involved in cell wall biosynthesis
LTSGAKAGNPSAGDTKPAVVVILCTCRSPGPMLAEAVDSLRNQTYEDWTLVIVDDGSPDPDGLDEFARAHGSPPVIHQERQGLCVARNVGLANSTSRYVAFLDDDDVWLPEKLERQVTLLEEHPDAVACHCQFEVFSEGGNALVGTAGPYDVDQLLRGEQYSLFPTMLVRRADIDACGWFSSNFPTAEDVDMTYRLARRGPVLFCADVLFRYRRHGSNMTNNLRASSLASLMALEVQRYRQSVLDDQAGIDAASEGQRAMRRYWADADLSGALALWRSGRRREALRLATWTLRTFPQATVGAVAKRTGQRAVERLPASLKRPPSD